MVKPIDALFMASFEIPGVCMTPNTNNTMQQNPVPPISIVLLPFISENFPETKAAKNNTILLIIVSILTVESDLPPLE